MSEKERLSNAIRIRVEKEIEDQLKIIAGNRGESVSEVCRRLIRKGLAEEVVSTQMDFLQVEIREALRDVLKPTEDRLAKLNAKTSVAAATAMYMNMQTIALAGKDAKTIHQEARKKAISYVKTPSKDE